MFQMSSLKEVGKMFLFLMGELLLLFIGISFLVALIQIYLSKDKIKRILTTPRKGLNSILGAILGAVTPFCSCSTVPILVGLLKSGAPFSGTISFLLTSPILNPAIIALFLTFFGLKATIIYTAFTFIFAVLIGLLLDKFGFEKEVKNVSIKGEQSGEIVYENLEGTFLEKNILAFKYAFFESLVLFKQVFPYLLLGAGIGSFIYEFVPEDLLSNFAGKSNILSVPIAALVGIPMYIRTETMIPIARILIDKGVGSGTMVALIIGGAGASIPELSLLGSIFKKKMMIAFVLSIFTVAIITGYVFNIIM
ncbi:putative membrane protein [[Clostridium] ultunense Esp]|uniref:Putative membrane protein n=1 Tax=[Clostridium] ultunense Esp TaxID=1288971 RepID=M1Z6M3_9FIRM|nr:permease [Schnuerera ultunensis]CCQ93671.1 putative membrane protein [[Clostridium] ultunense Esp]SHD77818.1 putative membrane protein [[Clostridium] ultunense Esp]